MEKYRQHRQAHRLLPAQVLLQTSSHLETIVPISEHAASCTSGLVLTQRLRHWMAGCAINRDSKVGSPSNAQSCRKKTKRVQAHRSVQALERRHLAAAAFFRLPKICDIYVKPDTVADRDVAAIAWRRKPGHAKEAD